MKSFFVEFFAFQPESSLQKEGLPFWLFWFLLSIIGLLIIFIFLRDKDLRQRLNAFLFGARKRWRLFWLQTRLKKEKKKMAEFLKELGRKAWSGNLRTEKGQEFAEELTLLEEKKTRLLGEKEDISSKIETLQKNREDADLKDQEKIRQQESEKMPLDEKIAELKNREKTFDKEPDEEKRKNETAAITREIEAAERTVHSLNKKIRQMEEERKERIQKFTREIREWEKTVARIEEKISDIDRQKEPLFEKLGRIMDEARVPHEELALLYSQIDRVKKTISDLKNQIENSRP